MNNQQYEAKYKELIKNAKDDNMLSSYIKELMENITDYPFSLYRYRKANEFTLSEILNQNIYLCEIDKMDDIFDGKGVWSPFGYKPEIIHRAFNLPPRNENEEISNVDWRKLMNDAKSKVKIACFTETMKNIPMWYYYADMHRGVCIEYKFKTIRDDNILMPIIYPDIKEANNFAYCPECENQKKCSALLNSYVKNEDWRFEKEWRVFSYDEDKEYLSAEIKTIYFGLNCPEQFKELVSNIITTKGYNIELKQISISIAGIGYKKFENNSSKGV